MPDEETGRTRMAAVLEPTDCGTRVAFATTSRSAEQLRRMPDMSTEEGLRLAMGQIDGILAEDAPA